VNHTTMPAHGHPSPLPDVREITLDHPWQWLAKGWDDLIRAPKHSLAYGVFFFLVSVLLTLGLYYQSLFFVVPPLAAGYFLVAPLLGIGLYSISEALETGEEVEFIRAWEAWKHNEVHLAGMGVTLLMVLMVWMMTANLMFALLYSSPVPSWENFIPQVFLSGDNPLFVFGGILAGGLIAALTFAISAISVPLLMDRQINLMDAIETSVRAVIRNWRPMLLWACLIAMFVGIGLVTFYIGLIVVMPWVGHATWHAYRDLVAPD